MALQRQFSGLSDFIGEYSLGKLQFELLGQVVPALNVETFINPPRELESTTDLDTVAANTLILTAEVPAGETWLIHDMGYITSSTLTGVLGVIPCALLPSQNTYRAFQTLQSTATWSAGQQAIEGMHFNQPYHAEQGSALGWWCTLVAGSSRPDIISNLHYTKFAV